MRFLVSLRPFYGHLHPLAPTARALQQAGHEVVFSTAEPFRAAVEAEGFRFVPTGRDPRAPLPDGERAAAARDWGAVATREKLGDLLALAEGWRPDAIVREQTDFAPLLLAEALDIPCATLGPALFIPARSWLKLQGNALDRIRADYGLTPDPEFRRLHPYLYLDVAPPFWQVPEAGELDVRHTIRPVVLSEHADAWTPPDTAGRPLGYVTLGTVYNRRPNLLRSLIAGAVDAGLAVVATTGVDHDPAALGLDGLAGAHVQRWLPQLDVLPHCDLVLAHGGFSTVMGALAHGLPLLVVPLGSDNPAHAERCGRLGVGLRMWARDVDAASVRDAVTLLLTEPEWRLKAEGLRDEILALPGPEHGAELLVRLAREGEPIVAGTPRRPHPASPNPRTVVVVPTYGRADLAHALLEDVAREPWVEAVVVDNAGDYDAVGGERILRPGRNLGWAGGCNHALRELADDGYAAFVLLNSDTRLSPGFFAGLWEARRQTGAWVVGPVYDGVWPYQTVQHTGVASSYRPRPVQRDVPFLDGTCLFLPSETIAAVGLLDAESFPRHGWGVDFDYALRTRCTGGTLSVTESAYLHHQGNATARLQGEGWQVGAWEEMVTGMRRKWGQAWPSRLRAGDESGVRAAPERPEDVHPSAGSAVFVLGPARCGGSVAARVVNQLGVAPPPPAARAELDGLSTRLIGDEWLPPAQPGELLAGPTVVEALADARSGLAGAGVSRPWVWRDPRNDFLLPFWSAALDMDIVAILVLREPAEVAESLRARFGWPRRKGLAYWERSLRHALLNLAALPTLVTTFDEILDDPVAWADRAEAFLSTAGLPLLVPSDRRVLGESVRPELRRQRAGSVPGEPSPEQQLLHERALELVGVHLHFPDVELPPETPGLDDDLHGLAGPDGHRPTNGRRSRLTQEWAEWIFENRRLGVPDEQLVPVLVGRGLAAADARTEIARVANGWVEPGYRLVNRAAWNQLVAVGATYTQPFGPEEFSAAREFLDDPLELPWAEIGSVLCLASGGGQQGPLFAALGRHVTVLDLSPSQLERDREVARAYGLEIECLEGDMLDLSPLGGRRFDLVYQPVSTCYVEDLEPLYRGVAGVLRDGGWYWSEHWNPVHMQLEGLGQWSGSGYRIVRPQRSAGPVVFTDDNGQEPPGTCWHFIHGLDPLLGSLCAAGFEIRGFAERYRGDAAASGGTDDHVSAHVPPLFAVLARREQVQASNGGGPFG